MYTYLVCAELLHGHLRHLPVGPEGVRQDILAKWDALRLQIDMKY